MHAIDHITRPAGVPEHDFQWFCEELDRLFAQLRRERNWRYGRPCQPLRRPKTRRRQPRR